MENIIILLSGIAIGTIITKLLQPNPYDLVSKVYAKYVEDMKHFATAYSELSVQFVNQHLPAAPPASFTRSMPQPRDPFENLDGAMQPDDDDADILGGSNNL